ncbi:MAG: hypothetical protein ACYC3S_11190 [Chloroflexota bacterium]
MVQNSVLGYLSMRFAPSPENLATEALGYVLQESSTARGELLNLLSAAGIHIRGDLTYRTQVDSDDGSICDLVGQNPNGEQVLVMEAKFWAGLTERQPVAYLSRLPTDCTSGLVFVAPAKRFHTLSDELLRRLLAAKIATDGFTSVGQEVVIARLDGHHHLAIISWRAVLQALSRALVTANDHAKAADVAQIEGLCAKMDSEAFLPLRGEDLSEAFPKRLLQYLEVIDELAALATTRGICNKDGLRATSLRASHGTYLRLAGVGIYLHVSYRKWYELRNTPFWITIHGREWKDWQSVRQQLSGWETESPARLLFYQKQSKSLVVPLFPPLGEEKGRVLEALYDQVRQLYDALAECPVGPEQIGPSSRPKSGAEVALSLVEAD